MRRFSDPVQPIVVGVDESFAVVLEGNPTTGYRWEAYGMLPLLEMLDRTFRPLGRGVGAGGQEVFHLHALQVGQAEIVFVHRRPWSGEMCDERRFQVIIQ